MQIYGIHQYTACFSESENIYILICGGHIFADFPGGGGLKIWPLPNFARKLKVGQFPNDTGWSVGFIFHYQTLFPHLW